MDFGALPPEVNSARMYAGPGAGPMLAAAAAWDGLAADLHSTAVSYQSSITGLTGGSWQGQASASMAAAVAPYVTWMSATAAQCEQVANQARAAVSAYESAFAMTVPPPPIAANRAQLMSLVATNFLGQNTPAIMATEAHYGEMWAQDATAMYGYAAGSAVATTLTPFTPPQQITNPSGLAGQAAAVAHAGGTSAATHAQTAISSISAVPQTLQSLASPTSSTSGLSQMVMSNGASLASSGGYGPASALSGLTGVSGKAALKSAGNSAGVGASAASGLGAPGSNAGASGLALDVEGLGTDFGGLGTDFGALGIDFAGVGGLEEAEGPLGLGPLGGGLGPMDDLGAARPLAGLGGGGASASLGQAGSLGALSVPQTWANVAPVASVSPAGTMAFPGAMAFPGTSFGAVPGVSPGGFGGPKLSLPTLGGREVDGAMQKLGFRPTVVSHFPLSG